MEDIHQFSLLTADHHNVLEDPSTHKGEFSGAQWITERGGAGKAHSQLYSIGGALDPFLNIVHINVIQNF